MDPRDEAGIETPPSTLLGIVKRLGPGLIIAGSIVGSGELVATTKTGAEAGITLLWLIIIGCVIKVFVQIELGRYTITHGETTLAALDQVPGPRWQVNWIVWFWLVMMVIGIGQLGGIVGGVGQAAAIAIPIRGDYLAAVEAPSQKEVLRYLRWEDDLQNNNGADLAKLAPRDSRPFGMDKSCSLSGCTISNPRTATWPSTCGEAKRSSTRKPGTTKSGRPSPRCLPRRCSIVAATGSYKTSPSCWSSCSRSSPWAMSSPCKRPSNGGSRARRFWKAFRFACPTPQRASTRWPRRWRRSASSALARRNCALIPTGAWRRAMRDSRASAPIVPPGPSALADGCA